ncbi:putative RNA helicase [Leucoagaricus gongylophorus]
MNHVVLPWIPPTQEKSIHVMDPYTRPPHSFSSFNISQALISALSRISIKIPTPVQAACIPPLLAGRDCVGNAKTGSGKTIAFALPILQKLSVDPYGIYALILTPTRRVYFSSALLSLTEFPCLWNPGNLLSKLRTSLLC